MHKSATKCNETLSKWCKNKHGASKIMDTLETYQGGPASLTPRWRRPDLGRATLGCGQALAPLRLIFGLHDASEKIADSAFVSSNYENISYIAFLKHKNSRKQGTGTVASH
jgi:hypothetical protein